MAGPDFSRSFIVGFGSSPSRHGPARRKPPGQTRDLPSSDVILLGVMGSSTTAEPSAPRLAELTVLPSAVSTASASATYNFRGSISHPTQSLCTLRDGRHLPPRNTRYQATANLTWTGFSPVGSRQLLGAQTLY